MQGEPALFKLVQDKVHDPLRCGKDERAYPVSLRRDFPEPFREPFGVLEKLYLFCV